MNCLLGIPMLLSLVFAISMVFIDFQSDKRIGHYALLCTSLISVAVFAVLALSYGSHCQILSLSTPLTIAFEVDGLSVIFASMVSVLWPIATYYAGTYMTHEGKFRRFFTYYTLTFGVVLGLAFSANLFTAYLFYEALSLVTLPLVIHNDDPQGIFAGRRYIRYMFFGAATAFMGMMLFLSQVGSFDFQLGGIMTQPLTPMLSIAYVLMFVGFGVKTGLFPFHRWLITAGVAPTTVTALLHAVAVVKSGAFVVMRLSYYLYDYTALHGTTAQAIVLVWVSVSILFGSFMAARSSHLKRRLAYSTVSQLSYILLGITTMSLFGLQAALLHMLFHAAMKIVLFYGAGNALYTNHAVYVDDIRGYGHVMKPTFVCFTICGLALMGLPPLAGFFSKYALAQSAIMVGGQLGLLGVVALLISAFFTAIYILQILLQAYLPATGFTLDTHAKPAPKSMQITVIVLTCIMVALSVCSGTVSNWIGGLLCC
ncbi:proton-conducting transporter membrane subunit [Bengtsoniella intestinalis]|uniref:complex I subunit 5 family protein n=1 Tax=Bengtsoniella intestinalis TaxID=3073143 RepID=UPI00391F9794